MIKFLLNAVSGEIPGTSLGRQNIIQPCHALCYFWWNTKWKLVQNFEFGSITKIFTFLIKKQFLTRHIPLPYALIRGTTFENFPRVSKHSMQLFVKINVRFYTNEISKSLVFTYTKTLCWWANTRPGKDFYSSGCLNLEPEILLQNAVNQVKQMVSDIITMFVILATLQKSNLVSRTTF